MSEGMFSLVENLMFFISYDINNGNSLILFNGGPEHLHQIILIMLK